MKKRLKAPWFVDPTPELHEPLFTFCASCNVVWDVPGCCSCPSCSRLLSLVEWGLISDDADNILIRRLYCPEHGSLAAHQVRFLQVKQGMPHEGERFNMSCSLCGQLVQPLAGRLIDLKATVRHK